MILVQSCLEDTRVSLALAVEDSHIMTLWSLQALISTTSAAGVPLTEDTISRRFAFIYWYFKETGEQVQCTRMQEKSPHTNLSTFNISDNTFKLFLLF